MEFILSTFPRFRFFTSLLVLFSVQAFAADGLAITLTPDGSVSGIAKHLSQNCRLCEHHMQDQTGAFILEHGEQSLMSRAWLVANAEKSIDVQYFIWSADNIGILATEALLVAAKRGVKVRVIVDDLLVDVKDIALLALNEHPNIDIKIYNPMHSVGVSKMKRALNVVTDFRGANQRMHDKTAIFDGVVGITGGRNMADEYFDYDHEYNFRDRDILLIGKAVNDMSENFDEFWSSDLSVPVDSLLQTQNFNNTTIHHYYSELHNYAADESNFEIEVRNMIEGMPDYFPSLFKNLVWTDVDFVNDSPGKNDNRFFLSGGSDSTDFLYDVIKNAKKEILIQTPYLVLPDGGFDVFSSLIERGVSIKIVTNSLASTDNLMAFSGYHKQRKRLIDIGVMVYEYRPYPKIQKDLLLRFPELAGKNPIFAIHAKSMVIDSEQLFIGTFNLDPRSANLNTEVGAYIKNIVLAKQLKTSIERDSSRDNSWLISHDFNPDKEVPLSKRVKLFLYKLLPLKQLL